MWAVEAILEFRIQRLTGRKKWFVTGWSEWSESEWMSEVFGHFSRSFAMGEWCNWKQTKKTDRSVPQSTWFSYMERTEVYMVRVLPVPNIFFSCESLCKSCTWALWDEFVSALVAHGSEWICRTHASFSYLSSISFLLESSSVILRVVLFSLASVWWVWPSFQSLGLHTWGSLIPAQLESQQLQGLQP